MQDPKTVKSILRDQRVGEEWVHKLAGNIDLLKRSTKRNEYFYFTTVMIGRSARIVRSDSLGELKAIIKNGWQARAMSDLLRHTIRYDDP